MRLRGISLTCAAIIAGMAIAGSPARAAFVLTIDQIGSSVVLAGSGSIDLTDLDLSAGGTSSATTIYPSIGEAIVSPDGVRIAEYKGISGPDNFGSGGFFSGGTETGAVAGIEVSFGNLLVESDYVSGAPLSDSATFSGQTFATLGITPGIYVYSWGRGDHADTFTLDIGDGSNPVPEPSTWALMLIGFGGLGFAARRLRRATAATVG